MSNSYIFTRGGLSVIINGKPYSVEQSHSNYPNVIEALRERRFDDIPDLINRVEAVQKYLDQDLSNSDVTVDVDFSIVYYKGVEVHNTVCDQILKMMDEGFSIKPLTAFLANLMLNPSKKAIDELYRWMTVNGFTITEDGYIIAYKRVKDDLTSFHDSKTKHEVGKEVEMPRGMVDDRSNVTCSTGLHFCSHTYLPQYCAGSGRVLILKIHPRDVVSIPEDYNDSKGRACKYLVLDELVDDARKVVEEKPVVTQSVITEQTDLNKTSEYKDGYERGYKDGRGKKKKMQQEEFFDFEFESGYQAGYGDGRKKNPKLY